MLFSPIPLHIPDGLLSLSVSLLTWAISILALAIALRRVGSDLGERQIPLMGVMAAFIFAAQMINFPVAGGTSGHLIGGVLAAVTLGPWAAMIAMASVIVLQGLLFQDGGLLVMGANLLNMGILPVLIGYGLYRTVSGRGRSLRLLVLGIGAWLSVMAGALATALQLWLSSTAHLGVVVPAMLSVHALIGVGEALISTAALAFLLRTRPDLIEAQGDSAASGKGWVVAGLILSCAVVLLAPLASSNPDGLERVAIDLGFVDRGVPMPFAVFPDYTIPLLRESSFSTIVAGILGGLAVAGVTIVSARLVGQARKMKTR